MDAPTTTRRDPDGTRQKLLEAAFEEIYLRGFQAASLEAILSAAGVTKGALYHHFASKAELGLAVLDEVIDRVMMEDWIDPVTSSTEDPISAIQRVIRAKAGKFTEQEIGLGCPLNNLAQEMSPLDDDFRERVGGTFSRWEDAFATALEEGQRAGTVRPEVDPQAVSAFLIAAVEGTFGRAKSARSRALLESNMDVLVSFLDTLRLEDDSRERKMRPGNQPRHTDQPVPKGDLP